MSIDPKYCDLIQADIDDALDGAGKAELEAFLAESEEGRALHAEYVDLLRSLDGMTPLDPPEHLRHVVMNRVPSAPAARSGGRRGSIFGIPLLGYVATFAAGVVLALALVFSYQNPDRAFDDVTGLVGTIANPGKAGIEHDSIIVDDGTVSGSVTLRSTGSLLMLDFDLAARRPVEIIASSSDQSIWFNGFAQLQSSGTKVTAESGSVRWQMDGQKRYIVFLHNPGLRPASIEVRILASGDVIDTANLEYRD